jgi:hypothetical protein
VQLAAPDTEYQPLPHSEHVDDETRSATVPNKPAEHNAQAADPDTETNLPALQLMQTVDATATNAVE